jgi:hypothetical protein
MLWPRTFVSELRSLTQNSREQLTEALHFFSSTATY